MSQWPRHSTPSTGTPFAASCSRASRSLAPRQSHTGPMQTRTALIGTRRKE